MRKRVVSNFINGCNVCHAFYGLQHTDRGTNQQCERGDKGRRRYKEQFFRIVCRYCA